VSDDVDRWVNMEGPEPEGVRQLLDGSVEPPVLTPEREAALDRRVYAIVAEKRAKHARQRVVKQVGLGAATAFAIAAGVVLVVRSAMAPDPVAGNPTPTDHRRAREIPTMRAPGLSPPPALSETAEPPDAGSARRPERR
jgi:hypothetical protein